MCWKKFGDHLLLTAKAEDTENEIRGCIRQFMKLGL